MHVCRQETADKEVHLFSELPLIIMGQLATQLSFIPQQISAGGAISPDITPQTSDQRSDTLIYDNCPLDQYMYP